MNTGFASLLVFHGSRNRLQYSTKVAKLTALVQKKLWLKNSTDSYSIASSQDWVISKTEPSTIAKVSVQSTSDLVEAAQLEFAQVELSQQIRDFAQKAIAKHYQKITIIPVFLSEGVHVKEDIPLAVAEAQKQLDSKITIEIEDYLGSSPHLIQLVRQQFWQQKTSQRILLAHGSRLPQGNVAIEHLAQAANAMVAYWTLQPDLTSQIELLANQNTPSVAIVPYFLFSGKITEAIASLTNELQNKFPRTQLLLGEPLGATPELAQLIAHQIAQN